MAFKPTTVHSTSTSDDSWKAQGFINISLPTKDGKPRKLGMIPLRDTNVNEKALRDYLENDPANVQSLLAKLIIDYQNATPAEGNSFDLS